MAVGWRSRGDGRTAADVAQPADAVHAVRLEAAVAQHLQDLRILLAVLLEHKLALNVVGLVLSPAPVLATLFDVFVSTISSSVSYLPSLSSSFLVLPVGSRSGNHGGGAQGKKKKRAPKRRGRGRNPLPLGAETYLSLVLRHDVVFPLVL